MMNGKDIAINIITNNDFLYYKELLIGNNEVIAKSDILNIEKNLYSGHIPPKEVADLSSNLATGMRAMLPFDVWEYGTYNEYQGRVYHNYTSTKPTGESLLLMNRDMQTRTLAQIERDLKSKPCQEDKELYKRVLAYGKKFEKIFNIQWF